MKFRALVVLFFLISCPRLFAYWGWEEMGTVSFSGEWLYFRPSTDTDFLIDSATTVVHKVVPSFHSGWRAEGKYLFCDGLNSVWVRGTHLRSSDSRDFSSTAFTIPFGFEAQDEVPIFASDKLETNYMAIEGLITHRLINMCRFNFDFIGGVQYAWNGVKEEVLVTDVAPVATAKQNGHFWGVGPEFGFDIRWQFLGCFSLTGRGTGALLISRVHGSVEAAEPDGASSLFYDPLWKVVPAWDFRAGVRYDYCCYCIDLFLEAGYEAITYIKGPRLFDVAVQGPQYSDFSMHGLYIALGLKY